jgi:hypothetical protein
LQGAGTAEIIETDLEGFDAVGLEMKKLIKGGAAE